ncbi:hypothetical protein O6H91_07G047400 [Diphasiastrum complanatum]|uniref:Uncharacterized protein n=1 Tax=Diphasiastrum complanatum TaxID=34168 RepID=A0ACC2D4W7_DIPCM|nr:hypothetical protein O6H91_07G047400 [Diphasiastrum complanatum]
MAFVKFSLCFMVIALMLSSFANAQCNPNNFGSLAQCLSAVGNQPGAPSTSCCNSLRPFQGKAQCLCDTLTVAKNKVPSINIQRALSVPKLCGFGSYIPAGFKCNGQSIPQV